MKTRITSLNAAVIAGSVMFLILTTHNIAAPQSMEPIRASGPSDGREMNFLSSLRPGPTVPGIYDLSFRAYRGSGILEPVSSLLVGDGPLVLFAHIEDTAGNPAQSGTVTFEYCGDFEPKETCNAGLARWTRLNRVSIGSCGGFPGLDPGPGNACLFVTETGGPGMEGDDGFRFKYAGRRGGVDSGTSGAANFTWTAAP